MTLARSGLELRTPRSRRVKLPGVIVAVALHAVALVALLRHAPLRETLASAGPIMVSLVAPPRLEVAPPRPEPPKPRAAPQPKPREPAPVITAPAEARSPIVAPAPPPEAPEPRAAPPAAAAAPPSPPVVPPRFNADYLHNPAPTYPLLSRRMGEQGKVVLRVLVTAAGLPERVELAATSGSARLDGAALETVQRWRFVPARQGDRPVAAWVLVPISFVLEG